MRDPQERLRDLKAIHERVERLLAELEEKG